MRRLADLLFSRRRTLPPHAIPGLAPEPSRADLRAPGVGIHLRRIGGAPVHTPRGAFPRIRGIEAIRGFHLGRSTIQEVVMLLDGRPIRTAPVALPADDAARRRKQAFNIWYDFSGVEPGVHRLSVRPRGLLGRLRTRGRRVVVEAPAPDDPSDCDARVTIAADDTRPLEDAIAALPSVVRDTRRSVLPDTVRSILLLRADQLGDLAISVPAILRLRRIFTEARVAIVVTRDNAEFARACGLFDTVIEAPFDEDPALGRRGMTQDGQDALRATLAPHAFDLAIDLGEGAQSRLLLLLSGARFLYGFRHGDHSWLSASFELNARDPADGLEVIPPARKLMAMIEALVAMRATTPEPLPGPSLDATTLARYGLTSGARFVVLHTGARLAYSRWPHFGALARLLLERTDLTVLMFTHEGAGAEPIAIPSAHAHRVRRIEGRIPFADFDAILSTCAVLVGNDSGPKHLAALRGAKVVSLHMARLNWNEWGQEGEGLIVSRRVPCAGCGIGDHPEECGRAFACLRGITAEEVCAAVLRLL